MHFSKADILLSNIHFPAHYDLFELESLYGSIAGSEGV